MYILYDIQRINHINFNVVNKEKFEIKRVVHIYKNNCKKKMVFIYTSLKSIYLLKYNIT